VPAKNVDLTIEQGTTFVQAIIAQDSTETPIDVSGYSARMQVRATHGSANTLIDLLSPADIDVGGADGMFTVNIADTVTAALTPGSAVYDFEMIDGLGNVTRVIEGAALITPEVTR